ncbi:hypothetical protein CK203_017382 [Vitis vinifera]|uniref:Uncharacterized protein n=1 Tax=Vitis vinifera TaxID=29760 RepID=A0A438K049_VITVI|nr:hypothetical protein CK203_017382 [Vitis vinifera]
MARPEEAIPPPHPHRHLDHIEPPWEPQLHHLFRPRPFPHLRGKLLLSVDTPPGGHHGPVPPVDQATSPVSRPPAKRTKFSGPGEPSHAPQPEPLQRTRIPADILSRPGPQTAARAPRFIPTAAEAPQSYLIQFTIDGRQGAIGARHIAEALHIPYEPVFQADFREWSSFSQSDMVRILSRGTSTASVLTRRELPSGMLLIDGAPAVAPPELPRDEQIPQAQQDEILTETPPPAPAAHLSAHARGYTFYLPYHSGSAPSEPLVPDEESLPAEQPIPEEEIRAEPSHDPTHI